MTNLNKIRPVEREHAWILAAAVAVITSIFTWILVPAMLAGNPLSDAVLPILKMAGSLLAAFAAFAALKLFLERKKGREQEKDSAPFNNRKSSSQYAPYTGRVNPVNSHNSRHKTQTGPQFKTDETVWNLELLQSLEWKRFEDLCNEYSKTKGMRTQTTRLGADGGIDIRIYRENGDLMSVVQCKAWKYDIHVNLIRELAGVMAHEKIKSGVFITTSRFTLDAKAFAAANRIILLDGNEFLNAIKTLPANEQEHLLNFATAGDYTTPTCPKCDVKMVRRKKYSEFWGCPNFPDCRQIIKIRKG